MHDYLVKALTENQLPNTLLFIGGEKAMSEAKALADHLLVGTKNDLFHLVPEGKLHTIEAIRAAIDCSHGAPFEAKTKVFIIESAERMQPAAANALLKTLEEPSSYWILLTEKPGEILPTILSRCTKVVISAEQEFPCSELEEAKSLFLQAESEAYHLQWASLEKIENLLESEDPLVYQKRAEQLFLFIAERYREKERWLEAFDDARLGFERNIRLANCLEVFLHRQ